MQTKAFLSLFLFLALVGLPGDSGAAEQAGIAAYHPLVRDYARERCMSVLSRTAPDGTQYLRVHPSTLNQHVDRYAQLYLDRLVQKLDSLNEHFETVQQARTEALAKTSGPNPKDQARRLWQKSLTALAESARDLSRTLSFVLVDLNRKAPFEPRIDRKSGNSGFKEEMEFMKGQIREADQRIHEYFFTPTHVIRFDDLQRGNMMVHLHRVTKMAKELRKRLNSDTPRRSRAELHTGQLDNGEPRRAG